MDLGDRDMEHSMAMDNLVDIIDPQFYVDGLRHRIGLSEIDTIIPKSLIDSMTAIIWDMAYINAETTFYKRLLTDVNILLINGDLKEDDEDDGKLMDMEANNNREKAEIDLIDDQPRPKSKQIGRASCRERV